MRLNKNKQTKNLPNNNSETKRTQTNQKDPPQQNTTKPNYKHKNHLRALCVSTSSNNLFSESLAHYTLSARLLVKIFHGIAPAVTMEGNRELSQDHAFG